LGFSGPHEVQKKPDFLDADLVRKSRAFGNFAKKKPNFWEKSGFCVVQFLFHNIFRAVHNKKLKNLENIR